MKKIQTLSIWVGILMALCLPITKAYADVTLNENGDLAMTVQFTDLPGSKSFKMDPLPNNDDLKFEINNVWNTNIKILGRSFGSAETKDFGFFKLPSGERSYFSIDSYSDNYPENQIKDKIIGSVIIKWSFEKEDHGGSLRFVGKENPFINGEIQNESYSEDTKINIILSPTLENEGEVEIIPNKKINYFALAYYEDGSNKVARINSIQINFVSEWTEPEQPGYDLTLGVPSAEIDDVEWSNQDMILDKYINFNNEDISTDNLTFYLVPQFDTSTQADISKMNETEKRLYNLLENSEIKYRYDGYFPEDQKEVICSISDGDGPLSLTINPPCSGIYDLCVRTNDGSPLPFKVNEKKLNIWPSIRNKYDFLHDETDLDPIYAFSINWINFKDDNYQTLHYPYNDNTIKDYPFAKDEGIIFIPGLYNAEVFYKLEYSSQRGIRPMDAETDDNNGFRSYPENSFNLNDLAVGNTATFEIKLKKNGAETPTENLGSDAPVSSDLFMIQLSDDVNAPLAVEGISVDNEDSLPVYYTVSGMRVNGANLTPGIYIKKQGRNVEKILISK